VAGPALDETANLKAVERTGKVRRVDSAALGERAHGETPRGFMRQSAFAWTAFTQTRSRHAT
jgi:hypothetical protein